MSRAWRFSIVTAIAGLMWIGFGTAGSAQGATDTTPLTPKAVYVPGGDVTLPRVISRGRAGHPLYTPDAMEQRVSGDVVIQCVVTTEGRATGCKVIQSAGFGLDEASVADVVEWRFAPGTKQGRAVNVLVTVTQQFRFAGAPRTMARPAGAPIDATAVCVDGTYSWSRTISTACADHAGIKTWFAEERSPDQR